MNPVGRAELRNLRRHRLALDGPIRAARGVGSRCASLPLEPAAGPHGCAEDSPSEVCIVHTVKSADLIKLLQRNGWVLRGVKGSHHVFSHPSRGGHISVPHPKKDLGTGLVEKLLKHAGLK